MEHVADIVPGRTKSDGRIVGASMRNEAVVFVGLCVLSAMPSAHHSAIARYDNNEVLELEGQMPGLQWANRHVYLTLEVTEPERKPVTWKREGLLVSSERVSSATF